MSKRVYNKVPLSYQAQIDLLKSRGLIVSDASKAINYLQEISYYRLSAYFLPYQKKKDQFNKEITFDQIIKTYSFDRELRLLLFDCIERIEIAIRAQFIYQMSHHYGDSHWLDKKQYFITPYYNKIGRLVDPYNNIQDIVSRAKTSHRPEVFIKHYIDNYKQPSNPPAWMCLELLTLGDLSHLFKSLKNKEDKKRISGFFDVHFSVLTSWLHTLTYVRNLCAHHSRVWNRDLAIEPNRLKKAKGPWLDKNFQNNKRIFYFICVLRYLLLRANPSNSLKTKLEALFNKYPMVPIKYLGIPSDGKGNLLDWKKQDIWK